jgi:hypothetical protein
MAHDNLTRFTITFGVVRICCGDIGHSFVRIPAGVTPRAHDVGKKLVCAIDSSGWIVDELRLAHLPIRQEAVPVGGMKRTPAQFFRLSFAPFQFRFCTAAISTSDHRTLVLRPKEIAQSSAATPVGHHPGDSSRDYYRNE